MRTGTPPTVTGMCRTALASWAPKARQGEGREGISGLVRLPEEGVRFQRATEGGKVLRMLESMASRNDLHASEFYKSKPTGDMVRAVKKDAHVGDWPQPRKLAHDLGKGAGGEDKA